MNTTPESFTCFPDSW